MLSVPIAAPSLSDPPVQPVECDRCWYPIIIGLIYSGPQTFRLCDLCWDKVLAVTGDLEMEVPPPGYLYSRGPLRLRPELRRHLIPRRMTDPAPPGSPLGLTPSAQLLAYCEFNASAQIDQETAEQQMAEERADLWMVWTRVRYQTNEQAACGLGMSQATLKRRVVQAHRWLLDRVNFGTVTR